MPETGKPEFTFDDVREAVSALDVADQHVVMAALAEQAAKRSAAEEAAELTRDTIYIAVVYERACAENASTSNIEGWYEELGSSAETLLEEFEDKMELSEIEVLARDTAAVVYVYLNLEHDNDAVDYDLLAKANVDTEELLKRFQDGVIEACVGQGDNRESVVSWVNNEFASLGDFSWNLNPLYWQRIVDPLALQLRTKLIESGVALPELNEEGKYGEDDELDL